MAGNFPKPANYSSLLKTRVRLFPDCQIVSGHHFFRFINQIACLCCLISNFDTSSLIIKLKSRYFWVIKQERLLIKQERWYFMLIKHVTFA